MRKMTSFYQKHGHPITLSMDLTPDFRSGSHAFRYNSCHASHAVKPAGIHDLMCAIVAFVLGVLTLGLFLSGFHDGVLFWLSIFFPVSTITALLKR
ncbi:MAG: hypothetical protein JXM72_02670 [Deltaproteobacteria bacterium]|nr:hypothetical protein [Deltaproteobacteria bacterium]